MAAPGPDAAPPGGRGALPGATRRKRYCHWCSRDFYLHGAPGPGEQSPRRRAKEAAVGSAGAPQLSVRQDAPGAMDKEESQVQGDRPAGGGRAGGGRAGGRG